MRSTKARHLPAIIGPEEPDRAIQRVNSISPFLESRNLLQSSEYGTAGPSSSDGRTGSKGCASPCRTGFPEVVANGKSTTAASATVLIRARKRITLDVAFHTESFVAIQYFNSHHSNTAA